MSIKNSVVIMAMGSIFITACAQGPEKLILGKWQEFLTPVQEERLENLQKEIAQLDVQIKSLDQYQHYRKVRELVDRKISAQRELFDLKNIKEKPGALEFLRDGTMIADNKDTAKYRVLDGERIEVTHVLGSAIMPIKISKEILNMDSKNFRKLKK